MVSNMIETIRTSLLEVIGSLQSVASHHHKQSLLNDLGTLKDTISQLPKRIKEKELPEPFVRTILDNARLDCLIAHSTIKISLCYLSIQSAVSSSNTLKQFSADITHSLEVFEISDSHPVAISKTLKDELTSDMQVIQNAGSKLKQIETWLVEEQHNNRSAFSSHSSDLKKLHTDGKTTTRLRNAKNGLT